MAKAFIVAVIETLALLPQGTIELSLQHLETTKEEPTIEQQDILITDSQVCPIDDRMFYGWQPPIEINVCL